MINKELANASVSKIEIERAAANQLWMAIYTARPGIVIGIKVWIYKGDILPVKRREASEIQQEMAAQPAAFPSRQREPGERRGGDRRRSTEGAARGERGSRQTGERPPRPQGERAPRPQ